MQVQVLVPVQVLVLRLNHRCRDPDHHKKVELVVRRRRQLLPWLRDSLATFHLPPKTTYVEVQSQTISACPVWCNVTVSDGVQLYRTLKDIDVNCTYYLQYFR